MQEKGLKMLKSPANPLASSLIGVTKNSGSHTFAFVGDSRLAQLFIDGQLTPTTQALGLPHVKSAHWFNFANALLGQRMKIAYAGGISGDRSDQYLANLPAAIASGASWLMIFSVVNDIGQSGTTGDTALTIWTRIKNATIQALNAGMNVILPTEPGSTSFSGTSEFGMVHQYNEYLREFADTTPGVYCFDLASVLVSPTSSSSTAIAFNTNYSEDGTHPNGYGSWYIGNALATFLSSLIPAQNSQIFTNNEIAANGNIQQQANPLFTTLTGGTAQTGITGSVPSGYTAGCTGSTTAAITSAADPNGFGNNITFTCNLAAAGDTVYFVTSNTSVTNYTIPGDIVEGGCEVSLAANSSGVNAIQMYCSWFGTGGNYLEDLYPLGSDAWPGVAMDLVLRTNPTKLISGITNTGWGVKLVAASAGTAVFTVKRPWFRRRFAL